MHLDAWGVLNQVDGYDIQLSTLPSSQNEKLYFVNLGGYDQSEFTELHRNICVVAESEKKPAAKLRKKSLTGLRRTE